MVLSVILSIVVLGLVISVWRLRSRQERLIKVVVNLHELGQRLLDSTASANEGGMILSNTVEALLKDFEDFQMNVAEFMHLTAEFMSHVRSKKKLPFFIKKPDEEKIN